MTSRGVIVGYHIAEGVSLWNHHIMACVECTPAMIGISAVLVTEAREMDKAGLPLICDTCEAPLLPDEDGTGE